MNDVQLLMLTELMQRYGSEITAIERGPDGIDTGTGDVRTLWLAHMPNGVKVRLFSDGVQAWVLTDATGTRLHRLDGPACTTVDRRNSADIWYIHGIALNQTQIEKMQAILKNE